MSERMKQKDRLYGVAPALPRLQAVKLGRRSAMCLSTGPHLYSSGKTR
ncbi:hypothetical protein B6N26_04859 (plasmid) [Salmonella enterica subsp. enterica]|nr:hypothetical protein B6N26_04738 [Salmonella enterica subsp. enterica]ARV71103.1 hypothetical protein B6N26_04859 [Salmonella enterica subsp. enterica]CEO37057.1 hypothetical protein [Salmonella enterica subsp. enterica serovar Typhimurium]CEO37198.1 hypothetical protein [Salmonella enterica subsp. enterica serovar Typhimurium]